VLEVQLTGKLAKEDYAAFVPGLAHLARRHGKIRVLVEMRDFCDCTAGSLFEHFSDIERPALVGERKREKGTTGFCRPFQSVKVRHFDHTHVDEARAWLEET
jgi:hypothetical protein